ncbi:MAG TPA: AraC family transcriptional regulator [Pyrinomonadaceae bacterium]|nr:AraC family transcriptional regulator [Pyrinomonadaceae bacterium]
MSIQTRTFDKQSSELSKTELIERISRALPQDGYVEALPGLVLFRSSVADKTVFSVMEPAFCVIAQGTKEIQIGDEVLRYDPGHYLITTVGLPALGRIVEASKDRPYLGLRLYLDPALVTSFTLESGIETRKGDSAARAMNVHPIDDDLLDAVVRMVRLLDRPNDIKALSPLILKEIIFRLLLEGQGARLRHLTAEQDHSRRISRGIKEVRENISQPLNIEDIARRLGMSVSGFHHHFKSVTSMSPIQFQKQLRLQEARRLMLGEDLDAASAGVRVGYGDPSYFNREYKKHFGSPPRQHIADLRNNL